MDAAGRSRGRRRSPLYRWNHRHELFPKGRKPGGRTDVWTDARSEAAANRAVRTRTPGGGGTTRSSVRGRASGSRAVPPPKKRVTVLRAAGDFWGGSFPAESIFFNDFWREKAAFTDPASNATFLCGKAEARPAPMLHAAASAVELVGDQCYCCACGMYATASAAATTTTTINSATGRRRRS